VIVFHVAMAYLKPAPSRQVVDKWVWRWSMLRLPEEITAGNYPWYKRLFLWWLVLLIVYVVLYIVFW
jgi:hypothetical protein